MFSKLETLLETPTKRLRNWVRRWEHRIAHALLTGDGITVGPDGGLILLDHCRPVGIFSHRVPGRDKEWTRDKNLVVDHGILAALGVLFYTTSKIPNWYLTIFNGAATPTNSLTMTTFAATQGEITSLTEGYTQTTRPAYTPSAPTANVVNNFASEATFTIATASQLNVTGSALMSDNTRGGTAGTLWSAALWTAPRTLYNGEPFSLGYQTGLSD